MTLKLITFDVTGTLLQLRECVGSQYAKIASKYNVIVPPDQLTKNFSTHFKIMLKKHPNFGANNGIGWNEWWQNLVFMVFQDSLPRNSVIEPMIFKKISSELIKVYSTKDCWKIADGAQTLLDNLRRKNLRLGVISNYDPRLENILADLNIRHYFSFVVNSFSANCEKPDSAIFELVEEMNGGIKKKEILHVGDNPRLDFMGAQNVGWNALLVAKDLKILDSYPEIESEWVVGSLGEIDEVLENRKLI